LKKITPTTLKENGKIAIESLPLGSPSVTNNIMQAETTTSEGISVSEEMSATDENSSARSQHVTNTGPSSEGENN
jgi:hypothetical protein